MSQPSDGTSPLPTDIAAEFIGFTGPFLIGGLVHWSLLGAFCVQLYNYYCTTRSSKDSILVKAFVWISCALQVVDLFFITHTLWYSLVTGWGVPDVAIHTAWSSTYIPVSTGTVTLVVQVFYAWRIPTLDKHIIWKLIGGLAVALSLLQWCATIAFTIEYKKNGYDYAAVYQPVLYTLALLWLIAAAIGDWVIATAMVILLQRARARVTLSHRTKSILNRLTRYVIESGIITATVAVLKLIIFKKLPSTTAPVSIEFILGSLYANIMLANLNGRENLLSSEENSFSFSVPTSGSRTLPDERFHRAPHISDNIKRADDLSIKSAGLESLDGNSVLNLTPIAKGRDLDF